MYILSIQPIELRVVHTRFGPPEALFVPDVDGRKNLKKNRKKVKKGVDKMRSICYYIGALEARTSKAKELQKNFKKS